MPQDVVGQESHGATYMRKPSVRRDESDGAPTISDDAKHADRNAVLQVVAPQLFRDIPVVPEGANTELLTCGRGQATFRSQSGDSPKDPFVWRLELDEQELPVHWNVVKEALIGQ